MSEENFESFGKIARLNRDIIVTEKIDGTNAQIFIRPDGSILAGSRNRWISERDDNYKFAQWVNENLDDLKSLGEGRHYGEWWGQGIGRKYDMDRKVFSLFNTNKWIDDRPECCSVVPVLYRGHFCQDAINDCLDKLKDDGSQASPGFMRPEGIIIWHTSVRQFFKITIENDEVPKSIADTA